MYNDPLAPISSMRRYFHYVLVFTIYIPHNSYYGVSIMNWLVFISGVSFGVSISVIAVVSLVIAGIRYQQKALEQKNSPVESNEARMRAVGDWLAAMRVRGGGH